MIIFFISAKQYIIDNRIIEYLINAKYKGI